MTGGAARPVDPAAIVAGAGVTLAVLIPPVAIIRALVGSRDDSSLWSAIPVAFLVAFALGGGVAARRAPAGPVKHAAVAGAAAFAVALAIGLVRNAMTGWDLSVAALVTAILFWQIAVAVSVVGGVLASRRRTAPEEAIEEATEE